MEGGKQKDVCRAKGVHKGNYHVCPPMSPRDPTPKKVLNAKSGHMSNMSLTWSGLSPGLDPRISRDPTPKKVLNAKSGHMSNMS